MGIYLHDAPPFNDRFFMTPPFSESQKVVTLPLFPPPSPLLISDQSLRCFVIVVVGGGGFFLFAFVKFVIGNKSFLLLLFFSVQMSVVL